MNSNAFAMIEDNRVGQYTSKTTAQKEARRMTSETGRKHYAMLCTTYRIENDFSVTPRLCWTVRLSFGPRNLSDAAHGSYQGCISCLA